MVSGTYCDRNDMSYLLGINSMSFQIEFKEELHKDTVTEIESFHFIPTHQEVQQGFGEEQLVVIGYKTAQQINF